MYGRGDWGDTHPDYEDHVQFDGGSPFPGKPAGRGMYRRNDSGMSTPRSRRPRAMIIQDVDALWILVCFQHPWNNHDVLNYLSMNAPPSKLCHPDRVYMDSH